MGDPKRHRKKYETPRHPWRADVLAEELKLVGEYGLRNKRELWRTAATLRKYRAIARSLFVLSGEERKEKEGVLIGKLAKLGVLPSTATLDDVLRLTVRDFLERRLQTVVYKLGLANSIHHARQLIVHGHVFVGDKKVRSPSYHVMAGEERLIRVLLPQFAKQE
ncbi:MAG: 30S ribosomal protein S4 [Thaumarchaeota archaeon]|jgi:small subunit ribosomal protein S4|nr:30S ribosomal protein S4 [Candidatus Terraquivivens yellowstonensis]MCL7400391.1 30S ribosomal protein S4 [Candidatus Terraquivivens yellowstonensis]